MRYTPSPSFSDCAAGVAPAPAAPAVTCGASIFTSAFGFTSFTFIERRISALPDDDVHRKLRAADILVVAVCGLERHVAEERVVDQRLDPLDLMLSVDVAADLGLVVAREADHAVALAA